MKKNAIRIAKSLIFLVLIVLLYLLCAWGIPKIPIQAEEKNEPVAVQIFLLTNGVHTDIVLPTKNHLMDWTKKVPIQHIRSQENNMPYLAFGWGDKGFYLDTPEWKDLKFSTAFRAAFWLSESAMHCTYHKQMKLGKDCIAIDLTNEQYKRLIRFIDDSFDKDIQGKYQFIPTDAVYGEYDAFYEAKGKYSFLYTCNTWANNALKNCGQKSALWTPSDFGIFNHYR